MIRRLSQWAGLWWCACVFWLAACSGEPGNSCGNGTVSVGGTCVPAPFDVVQCGPGTTSADGVCTAPGEPDAGADSAADIAEDVAEVGTTDVAADVDPVDVAETDVATPDIAPDLAVEDANVADLLADSAVPQDVPQDTLEDSADTQNASDSAEDVGDSTALDTAAPDVSLDAAADAQASTDAQVDIGPDFLTCLPNCLGLECGDDGCGGSCGVCSNPAKPTCDPVAGLCKATCTPKCTGKACGDDGCGGQCGTCESDQLCATSGTCVPKTWTCDLVAYAAGDACDCGCGAVDPDCAAGLSVYGCSAYQTCSAQGLCVSTLPAAWTCAPSTYAALDGCHCGCGAVDPDCAFGLEVIGCGVGGTCDNQGACVACVEDCTGKSCGDNGCGGSCGDCTDPTNSYCQAGQCIDPCAGPKPVVCEDAQCGDDGCGGSCGTCKAGSSCTFGLCVADPPGPDSCQGHCGSKAPSGCSCTDNCTANGNCCADYEAACGCEADCEAKNCGSDGCGGSCGTCGGGTPYCVSGQCASTCTVQCDNKTCGDDGCGGQCGLCGAGSTCGYTGQCVPAAWRCDAAYYDDGKTCDCGCGAGDPDCESPLVPVLGCPDLIGCGTGGGCDMSFCGKDSDCGAQLCVGTWPKSASVYAGICSAANALGGPTGSPCDGPTDCQSALCLDGYCRDHCTADSDCTADYSCVALPVSSGQSTLFKGFAAACVWLPGSAKSCSSQASCASDEFCVAEVDPVTLGARYLCEFRAATPATGTSCLVNECPSWQVCAAPVPGLTSTAPVCALPCPAGASDCPQGWSCLQRPLHNNGTPDPTDDQMVPLCLPN